MARGLFSLIIIFSSSLTWAAPFQIPSKALFKKNLEARKISLNSWLEKLNSEHFDLICFGETHNSYFRSFVSEKIIPNINTQALAIEDRPEKAQALSSLPIPDGIKVTGENFSPVAQAFFDHNPQGEIIGIEAQKKQKAEITFFQLNQLTGTPEDWGPSRDSFIAENLDAILKIQSRVFSLYGSNHCSYFSKGLGRDTPFIKQISAKYGDTKKIINVHTLLPEEESLLKIYLKEFELFEEGQDFVLFDVRSIDPAVYNHRMDLFKWLRAYDVIIFPAD